MSPIRLLIFGLLFVALSGASVCAQSVTDSLIKEIPNAKDDTNKVMLLFNISSRYFQTEPEKGIKYGKQALELAEQLDYDLGIIRSNMSISRCYAIQNEYTEALRYMQAALTETKKLKKPSHIAAVAISLGAIYTGKEEYDKALEYLMMAKNTYETTNLKSTAYLMMNIGNVYHKKGDIEQAIRYYTKGVNIELERAQPTGTLASLYSNIGGMYVLQKDYPNATLYLTKALEIQQKLGNEKSAAHTLNNLGEAYYSAALNPELPLPDSMQNQQANFAKAIKYFERSLAISQKFGMRQIYVLNYENLADVYEQLRNYPKAYEYYKKKMQLKDSLRDINEEKRFAKVEAEFAVKKKTDSLKYANALKDEEIVKSKTIRNGSIALVGLICVLGVVVVNRQNINRKKLKAEKALTDNRLASATHRLDIFTKNLQEKNSLIENFTEEIERLQALPCSHELPDTKENLLKLQNAIILTDEQWDEFKDLFETVHNGFLTRLKTKMPDLTPAETRFLALSKLKLSNKEMANMLGIGLSGMRNYKYRLRKKLDIADDSEFEELIEGI